MKKRIVLALSAAAVSMLTVSVAFAGLPVCSGSSPRGQVCADGTKVKTSCGNGKFLNGAVRNAGNLDDGCFALGNQTGPVKDTAKKKKEERRRAPSN